jgi:hypothetical protein
MNYSDNESSCRVDLFTQNGKWKYTIAVDFGVFYNEPLIHDAFRMAMQRYFDEWDRGEVRYRGMRAVCLEPYHVHAHPITIDIPEEGPLLKGEEPCPF